METIIFESKKAIEVAKKLLDSKRATQQEALQEYLKNPEIKSAIDKLKARNELRGTPVINAI